jgi:hypothetical protein
MLNDRRKPVARYVLFTDTSVQQRFADAAEASFADLARLDQWAGRSTLTLPSKPVVTKRGLLRRAVEESAPPDVLSVTAALSAAGEAGRDVPSRVAGLGGCAAERKLSAAIGRVELDLVRDLAEVPVGEQATHPAYRQTLRVAAELQALHQILLVVGCHTSFGCVRPRPPEQWGRREEDVEVAEVRSVLLELAESAEAEGL